MAEKVALDLLINAADSAKTVGEIKQSIKDIKNEMLKVGENSAEFKKLANAAAQAKDKLEDTQDAIAALDPGKLGTAFTNLGSKIAGGFQAAQGAMALFGSTGEDVQKAMLKVQAATAFAQGIQSVQDLGKAFKAFWLVLRANPIGLILTVVTALIGVFVALKDKVKIFGEAFDFASGIVSKGVQFFKDLSDAIGLSSFKLDELKEKTKQYNNAALRTQENVLKIETANYDRRIALAKELQKNTIDLEIEKEKFILSKTKEMQALAEKSGQNTLEYIQRVADSANRLKILQIKRNKELEDEEKLNAVTFNDAINTINEEQQAEELRRLTESEQAKTEILQTEADLRLQAQAELGLAQLEQEKKINEEKLLEAKRIADAKLSIEQSLFSGLSSLGQILINDGEKLQKFQKGLALAQLGVDTARALSSALANANAPTPDNVATGGLAGVAKYAGLAAMILANIAKAKQLLSSGGSFSAPTLGGGGASFNSPRPPQINPVSNTNTQINQNAVDNGQGQLLKVFVTETDISNTQNNVNQIVSQATIE